MTNTAHPGRTERVAVRQAQQATEQTRSSNVARLVGRPSRTGRRSRIRKTVMLVSLLFFPVTLYYFSPVVALGAGSAGLLSGSVVVFLAQFVVSLIVGRAFCGWLCPAGGLQDLVAGIQGKPVSPRVGRIKWIIWVPWIVFLVVTLVRSGGIRGIDLLYQTEYGISVVDVPGYFAYFGVLALFLVLSLTVGRRGACHTVCWMAPFMVAGRALRNLLRLPALKLTALPADCTSCGRCSTTCPMSIDVRGLVADGDVESSRCILCGSCADSCPRGVIRFAFGRPRRA